MNKKDLLDALKKAKSEKPSRCASCNHPLAEQIRAFRDMRESGEATYDWSVFHRVLVANNYAYGYSAMMRHVRECLGGVV